MAIERRHTEQMLHGQYAKMVAWRRHMHQYPELSFREKETSSWIASQLQEMGCETKLGVGGHGIVASIRGMGDGPSIALRADMDGLPIQDEKSCDYASKVPGIMHACGHDGHTSALLAVADYYLNNRDKFRGERRLLFQPAEEVTPGGAIEMVKDGAIDGIDAIYGVHLWAPLPYGTVASRPGPFMSAADEFVIDIEGKGGHGGMPHHTVDTIIAGSAIVQAVQTIVSRNVNPLHPAVVTIGSFQAGSTNNVIAEKCQMKGTVRSFDERTRKLIHDRLEAVVRQTSEMYGAACRYDIRIGYPPVVNDEAEAGRFFRVAAELFGAESVEQAEPLTVAEDFSYYLEKVPGCFMFVGAGNPEAGATYPHHHPRFDFDERAMLYSARLLIGMAEDYAGTSAKQ
ncbi:M20 family metallopeptidase [Paenibacillus sp. LHD-117]|uniref:M20 family metallopeptidase n=1 Tax=Paenibacillus sp. LHD-117 TaxID=3071412 RepID=UPI0027E0F832|nr:M20 family metallopeptidase [Paenibacillus sp. LHD-117]MDQ6420851.1 M20 family metallopeptidase [Paenibacillus sp. LHD-117]